MKDNIPPDSMWEPLDNFTLCCIWHSVSLLAIHSRSSGRSYAPSSISSIVSGGAPEWDPVAAQEFDGSE